MSMAILPTSLAIPRHPHQALSSARVLMGPQQFGIHPLPIQSISSFPSSLIIRMGGGPRTFPGGVSKWQWKRMQAKKAKQLLKARLCRERQIYEMRKRAELKAAVSELEKPWEVVERAPALFSVSADEQVKVLADRFQRAGGFDMWSERDGPQIFQAPDGLPSARFFPKGVVHSVKPYGIVTRSLESDGADDLEGGKELQFDDWISRGGGGTRRRSRRASNRGGRGGSEFVDVGSTDSVEENNQVAESTYSNSRNSRFSRNSEHEEGNVMDSQRASGKSVQGGFSGGRDAKVSPYGSSRNRGDRRSQGFEDSYEGRDAKGSPYDSSRIRGNRRSQEFTGSFEGRDAKVSSSDSLRNHGNRRSQGFEDSYEGKDAKVSPYSSPRNRGNRRSHGSEGSFEGRNAKVSSYDNLQNRGNRKTQGFEDSYEGRDAKVSPYGSPRNRGNPRSHGFEGSFEGRDAKVSSYDSLRNRGNQKTQGFEGSFEGRDAKVSSYGSLRHRGNRRTQGFEGSFVGRDAKVSSYDSLRNRGNRKTRGFKGSYGSDSGVMGTAEKKLVGWWAGEGTTTAIAALPVQDRIE